LARQSRLGWASLRQPEQPPPPAKRCISFPYGPKILFAEGTIDRHSQEALFVVVDDYDADTSLFAYGADFLA
jgi:hypothetical protein